MAEYKVTINATPSKAKVISVSPKNVQNTITASPDTSLYFSNLSRKWATEMDGMVNGEDYSSKYYANVSAENAQISQTNAQACEDARVLLQGEYNEYSEELSVKFDDLNATAESVVSTGKSELQTELSNLRTSASSIVSTSKTDIQNSATSAKNTAISAIQTQQTTSVNAVKTEGTTQVNLAKAQATAAANSATQASNVVKQVEDDLDSKVDIDDMVEVDFVEVLTITEIYNNEVNGYIVFEGNICLEWGRVSISNEGGSVEVALLKPQTTGTYIILTGLGRGTAGANNYPFYKNQTESGFTIVSDSVSTVSWATLGKVR